MKLYQENASLVEKNNFFDSLENKNVFLRGIMMPETNLLFQLGKFTMSDINCIEKQVQDDSKQFSDYLYKNLDYK